MEHTISLICGSALYAEKDWMVNNMRLIDADDCKNLMYVMCAGQDKNFVIAMEQVIDDTPTINMDYMAKINLWLIQRYRDDLFKEFGVHPNDISAVMKMFDKIYEEQCKEMPLPWYQYGLGLKETET